MPTATLKITVDDCDRCTTKIQKVLSCIQERCEFVIEKVVYEKDKVTVSGPFDANKLSCSFWSKAGRIIKNIEVVKEDDKDKDKDKDKTKCKMVYACPFPYPCPQPGGGGGFTTPHGGCHHQHSCTCCKPAAPPACQCHFPTTSSSSSSCYCGSCQPYASPLACSSPMPSACPPMPYPMLVCEDSPPTCAVM